MFCSLGLYGPSLVASVLYLSAIAQVGGFFFFFVCSFLVLVAGSMVDRSVVIEAHLLAVAFLTQGCLFSCVFVLLYYPFHINESSHFSRKEMAAIA